MLRSLVGSEMCIRDSFPDDAEVFALPQPPATGRCFALRLKAASRLHLFWMQEPSCLLYTSDAADEEDSVDLGGRRIIKKKKTEVKNRSERTQETDRTANNGSE
eukprot:TRINITY_DN10227_c0_g2_i1.p1 TRINITY_DN10227_c0_g2~~TRINITY_DN10227_c0_g2_i1.p1  ORF type:complete len:104 (-),score=26.75 TRINITY_DN10227_c0_g2_i1:63-374(-)